MADDSHRQAGGMGDARRSGRSQKPRGTGGARTSDGSRTSGRPERGRPERNGRAESGGRPDQSGRPEAGRRSDGERRNERSDGQRDGRSGDKRGGRSGGARGGNAARRGERRGTDERGGNARRAGTDPRGVAYEVLRAVDERDAYANLVLPQLLRERGMGGRDAALATELTYGTLRGRGTYDAVLALCSDRPLDRIDPALLDALRLGGHQLLRTRVPAHAAVATTVNLVRAHVGEGPARFANAILRKITTRELDAWLEIAAPAVDTDPAGHLSVVHSHPRWIVSALRDAVGGGIEETAALLAADNAAPGVTLLAKPGQATIEELTEAGATPTTWSPYGAHLASGEPARIPAVAEGRAAVQDEASQLVAVTLAAAPLLAPAGAPDAGPRSGGEGRTGNGGVWLDMCAGPGGKASVLAGLAGARGARVLACDVGRNRAKLARRALDGEVRAGNAAVVVADGAGAAWKDAGFDRVLVDAPCTGLGALRRRPEARWRRGPEAVAELGQVQRRLLASALDAVRPGGVVAYATCSPHLAETRVVVEDILRKRPDVEVLDAPAVLTEALGAAPELDPGPYLWLWPHRHGTDAMFCALLRRGPIA